MAREKSGLSLLWHLFATGERVKHLLSSAMADSPLSPDEYAVYSVLFDLGPRTPTGLARTVGMPPTTMSHYVRSMIERGHARKRPTPADGRSFLLTLTEAGQHAHRAAGAAFREANMRFTAALEVEEAFLEGALAHLGRAADAAASQLTRESRRAG